MKRQLFAFAALLLIVADVQCLFGNTTATKFNISGINNPTKIALSGSGEKFVVWNNVSNIQILSVAGAKQCQTSFDRQIQRVLWPVNYYPLILPFPGDIVWRLNETSCQILQTYNFSRIANSSEIIIEITEMVFSWRGATPVLGGSGVIFVLEIELNRQNLLNFYGIADVTYPTFQLAAYSADSKLIYVVLARSDTGVRMIEVFDTGKLAGKPIREIQLGAAAITSLVASRDNTSIISVGTSISGFTTSLNQFDFHGNNKNTGSRPNIAKGLAVGDGNVAVLFKTGSSGFQVVRVGDGKSLQNTTYYGSGSTSIYDADYNNKVIIMLDNIGTVVTASYEPDADPDPIPDPVDPSIPMWVVVAGVAVGVILLTFILLYVFREKLPENFRKKLPRFFNDPKDEEKKSLIESENEKNAADRANQNAANVVVDDRADPAHVPIINPNPVPAPIYVPPPPVVVHRPPNRGGYMSDAEIMKRQEERRHLQQLERQRQERLREEYLRQQQQEQQQQRLVQIERRRREEFDRLERERVMREEAERLRKEDARRLEELQKMEGEKQGVQQENKRLEEERKRNQYRRFLQEQQRHRFVPDPSSTSSNNPSSQPGSNQSISMAKEYAKQPAKLQQQQMRIDFISQRNKLFNNPKAFEEKMQSEKMGGQKTEGEKGETTDPSFFQAKQNQDIGDYDHFSG